jgi:hypothetical protein
MTTTKAGTSPNRALKPLVSLCAALPILALGAVGVFCKLGWLDREAANFWAGLVATIASIFALIIGCVRFGEEPIPGQYLTKLKVFLLIAWTLLPPLCFLFEFLHFPPGDLHNFQYEQDLKSKLWLALVTALTALYFGKDILRRR